MWLKFHTKQTQSDKRGRYKQAEGFLLVKSNKPEGITSGMAQRSIQWGALLWQVCDGGESVC